MNFLDKKKFQDLPKTYHPEKQRSIPNLLIIAGTGRNVGKTMLVCELIRQTAIKHSVVALKISPHLHKQAPGQHFIVQNTDFVIIEETNPDTGKDSSRMLKAGADKVFYVQTIDRDIQKPFSILLEMIPKHLPIICESGALLEYVRPGLFLLVKSPVGQSTKKDLEHLTYQPDDWLIFDGQCFNRDLKSYQFESEHWIKLK